MTSFASTYVVLAVVSILPTAWAQYPEQQKLVASDGASFDGLGTSVGISGDTVVVGAYQDNLGQLTDAGSAYVFQATGTSWSQQQKLTASDAMFEDQFGNSVAIWDDTIVVGARFVDVNGTNSGAAYVFVRTAGVWSQQQKLLALDGAAFDGFGAQVAVSGDTLVVGAPNNSNPVFEAGAVYVFVRSGATWTFHQKLVASDAALRDGFGFALSIDGDKLVVGAPGRDDGGQNAGCAYVFVRNGNSWGQQQRLNAFDPADNDWFGLSVSVSGGTVVVGSFRDDDAGTNSGSAYVYRSIGSAWSLQQKLLASNGAQGDEFGIASSISGDRIVVGAHEAIVGPVRRGTAYLFERRGTTWTQAQQLNSNDPLFDGGSFGATASISGDRLVVGDPRDEVHGQDSGAAHVFAAIEPGLASCFGTSCPCANDDPTAGCANNTGVGGRLGGAGSSSVGADDLVLQATQLPPDRLALFVASAFQGSAPVYNGIQCAANPLFRYASQMQSSGAAGVATLNGPVANSAGFISAGTTRYFQVVYRDRLQLPCGAAGNWTNLYGVTFTP